MFFAIAVPGLLLCAATAQASPWYIDVVTRGNTSGASFDREYDSLTDTPTEPANSVFDTAFWCTSGDVCGYAYGMAEASLPEGGLRVAATGSPTRGTYYWGPNVSGVLGTAYSYAILNDTLTFSIPGAGATTMTPATFRIALSGAPWFPEDNSFSPT